MDTFALLIFFLLFLWLLCYRRLSTRKGSGRVPTNWPVVGMLPGLLANYGRIHDFVTEILDQTGGTFLFKGPIFVNMDMLVVSDPADVNYVLNKNFTNYGRGPEFRKIFGALGDGIFVAETQLWQHQRRIVKSVIGCARLREFVATTTWKKMEMGVLPIMERAAEKGIEVDLQELFQRFTFDCSCSFVLGCDPASLSQGPHNLPSERAFVEAEEAFMYRHMLPEFVWKVQQWLQMGKEMKLRRGMESINQFVSYCVSLKQESLKPTNALMNGNSKKNPDMLTSCIAKMCDTTNLSEKVTKDLMLNLIFAGKDTISATLVWFFWLLATNPIEEEKIRNEVRRNLQELGDWKFSNVEMLNKLMYLHGGVCEALRLFPAVPIHHKAPVKPDILPSGHRIKANTKTLLSFYSMGRMESIWGKDCREFKPGRWISEEGQIKVEPSYKFTAFGCGPWSCLGKEISFIQLKIVAAAIVSRFKIEVADGHSIQPSTSIVFHMKHGLKVKVSRYV